ncbi:MAG: hypothetical protein LQ342_006314 [Letrouitia transgressa]|nr:MAG: hypothetical protein LQ342_006314 [Letrouitia transgressa]
MSSRRADPRPKRGGEEFARTHHLEDESPLKKPRFDVRNPSTLAPDAPEEDAVLEADEVGRRGQQTKRNAVNIDGYGSDSSNEGFDARADVKARLAEKEAKESLESKIEEDYDMFADLDEKLKDGDENEELAVEGKKQKKAVRFLRIDEIPGQIFSSKGGGHVSSDFSLRGSGPTGQPLGSGNKQAEQIDTSSESDVPDEVRAEIGEDVDEEVGAGGKKEHAPKLDAFNMIAEQEEGMFDEQLNYVRKAPDPDAVHDSWLEGVSKKDMKRAKEAEDKRDQERRQKTLEADSVLTKDILRNLIPCLERCETVLEALQRLGLGKEKKKPKWATKQKNKPLNEDTVDAETGQASEDLAELRRKTVVETITDAADQLLSRGQTNIYDTEKEMLIRQYGRETGETWADPPKEISDKVHELKQWEYRWVDERDGGQANGPYDGSMMASWADAGYFSEGVEFRRAGAKDEWSRSVDSV